ncbi:MAG TPA: thioesterase family protein [Thermoanaerobaculia bacterium]|nr:thioesterase family protein [Thermoanaerobaculia bacterium]
MSARSDADAAGDARNAHHIEPIEVRWGDLDSMGHVNNAKYFTYCESARMSYFRAVSMDDHREGGRFGPALAAAHLNFRRQVRYPSSLEVATRVTEIGRSSFRMEYEIRDRAAGERVADGFGVIVWTDYQSGRSTPLPAAFKETLQSFEGMSRPAGNETGNETGNEERNEK